MHSPEPPNPNLPVVQTGLGIVPRQAETDAHLVELWLHGRSPHTQRAYRNDVARFMAAVTKPLHQVTLGDLQGFATSLDAAGLMPASRNRILSSVKSVFAFGFRLGYLPFDVGRPLKLPGFRDGLADRILDQHSILKMIALEPNPRNHCLLVVLYASGVRCSELCALRWAHTQPRDDAGQITVFGKRSKTRTILLPKSVWSLMMSIRGDAPESAPVFRSRKKGHLTQPQVWRIVRKAAVRAGISKPVSPHFYRHAHASLALEHGASIALVQSTLGHSNITSTSRYLHARVGDSSSKYLPL